eukprot:7384591-Prymnesium_polylepis.1
MALITRWTWEPSADVPSNWIGVGAAVLLRASALSGISLSTHRLHLGVGIEPRDHLHAHRPLEDALSRWETIKRHIQGLHCERGSHILSSCEFECAQPTHP